MFEFAISCCGIGIIFCLVRVVLGPSSFDRVLAVNAIGSLVILGITLQ